MCVYVRKQWQNRMATWIREHQRAPETFVEQQKMTIRHCSSINFIVFYQILKGNELVHDVSTHTNKKKRDHAPCLNAIEWDIGNDGWRRFDIDVDIPDSVGRILVQILLFSSCLTMAVVSIVSSKFMTVSFSHRSKRKYLLTRRFQLFHRFDEKLFKRNMKCELAPERRVNWSRFIPSDNGEFVTPWIGDF